MRYALAAAFLLVSSARMASAQDVSSAPELVLHKSSIGGTGVIWVVEVQNRDSDLTVSSFKINNGTCPAEFSSEKSKPPYQIRFGQTFRINTINCEPIKVFISSSKGPASFYFDGADRSEGAIVRVERVAQGMRRLKITSLSSISIYGIDVNRGFCSKVGVVDYSGPKVLNYGEVYRTGFIPCDPVEVVLIADIGRIKADLAAY